MDMHPLTPDWEFVADTVMGGVSQGRVTREQVQGRAAVRLQGTVSLDNNGGFVQVAGDVEAGVNPAEWTGLALDVTGNGEAYDFRLRTDDLTRPWQSYRTEFDAPATWQRLIFAFSDFKPNRTEAPFAPATLRRVGLLAIGRVFEADLAISGLHLYR